MEPTESSSKRKKLGTKLDQHGIDRLTNLPNPIRINILSFLSTEAAIATGVLSKRWRSLWTLVPNLDFDESRNKRKRATIVPNRNPQRPNSSQIPNRRFEDFVTKVLLHRKLLPIARFRLKVHSPCHQSDLDLWVSSAIARNVQELELDLVPSRLLALPRAQQPCKTLRVLKLSFVSINGRLGKILFPNLRVLHLKRVEWETREVSLFGFLSSRKFPLLEELVLENYLDDYDDRRLEISFPNLRSLGIEFHPGSGPLSKKFTLSIDCPALRHFYLIDHYTREFNLGNLSNLVKASVDISNIMHSDRWCDHLHSARENGDAFYGRYVMNLVKAISNVTTLSLSKSAMREIERASSYSFFRWKDIPIFHNLVKVDLTLNGSTWDNLVFMLHKFENLKYLDLCTPSYHGEWIQPKIVPNFLTFHVTTICFREFQGSGNEMKAVKYVLEKSLVLKKMTFLFSSSLSSEDGCRIRRDLSKSTRCSAGCELKCYRRRLS